MQKLMKIIILNEMLNKSQDINKSTRSIIVNNIVLTVFRLIKQILPDFFVYFCLDVRLRSLCFLNFIVNLLFINQYFSISETWDIIFFQIGCLCLFQLFIWLHLFITPISMRFIQTSAFESNVNVLLILFVTITLDFCLFLRYLDFAFSQC